MARRITTNGSDNWQARSGYRRMSDQNARLARPKGEMSWLEGSLLLAVLCGIATLLVVAFHG